MKILTIAGIIVLVIFSICIYRIVSWSPPSYLPVDTDMIHINMKFIGKMMAHGVIYCQDNIGIEMRYNNRSRWVSMKEICNKYI